MVAVAENQRELENTIEVQGLNHYYGTGDLRVQILHDLNLTIQPGELVIMTGPSGCGKTTLLTLIGGLRRVHEGSLRVLGREMLGLDDRQLVDVRRDIGFIFQAHNLFESLTALRNVCMALELKNGSSSDSRRQAEQALIDVGLEERIHYKPKGLSGGQRQRVAVARALVNRPRLVLADEPTAALDSKATDLVLDQMRQMAATLGSTILIVTHDVKILNKADRIVAMAEGRIKSNTSVTESIRLCMFLSRCPAFATLKPEDLANMAGRLVLETHPSGTAIVRQGDEGNKFYIINRGQAEVLRGEDGQSEPKSLAKLSEGDFFGETALMEDNPRNATVVARTDLQVYSLDKPAFMHALELTAPLREQLLKVYYQRQ